MKFVFQKSYFLCFLFISLLEIGIAYFIKDRFIRPYVGDGLVILLMFLFVRSFYKNGSDIAVVAGIFLIASLVEVGQFLNLVTFFNLENINLVNVVFGRTFDWIDILVYLSVSVLILIFLYFKKEISGQKNLDS